MKNKSEQVSCPNCGHSIDVGGLLYEQLEKRAEENAQAVLKDKESALQEQLVVDRKSLQMEWQQREQQMRQQFSESEAERLESLKTQLQEQSTKIKKLHEAESQILRLQREKSEMRSEIELQAEKKLGQQLRIEQEKIQKIAEEKAQLKVIEKEALIEQLNQQLTEAQRKVQQGSVQLQGEAQEIAIEQWLQSEFPLDEIEAVKQGQQGADILQTINTTRQKHCATIYYESKRTKRFQAAWIDKLKEDMQARRADVGVLVTQSMPKGLSTLGQIEGIWVCRFDEFANLATVLRESLIALHLSVATQSNKGEKMTMLYDYLTGTDFKLQIEAIVEGFTRLKSELDKEKRAMEGIWKRREMQIEKVLRNTNFMYNSVRGIAGTEISEVALLELDSSTNNE